MENKNQYQALLRGKIDSALAEARSAKGITHQGVKGAALEILLSKLFRPLLPADIGVGTGQVIDSFGTPPSNQIDIVVFNKEILPPVLIDDKMGLFPIESVLYTIEVKTTLTSSELRNAHLSAKNINQSFKFLPGKFDEDKKRVHHPISKPRAVVFALNSNLKKNGMSEAKRYMEMYKSDRSYLSAICVAGREYCYEDRDCWQSMRNVEDSDEVLNLIAGITNTYRSVSDSRGYPLLGHYVATDRNPPSLVSFEKIPNLTVKCNKCGNIRNKSFTFEIEDKTLTNMTITDSIPCECGGQMISDIGTYVIKNGRIREIKS